MKEICRSIELPIWICWATSVVIMLTLALASIFTSNRHTKMVFISSAFMVLISIAIGVGLIFYSANDMLKRHKNHEEEMKYWKTELETMKKGASNGG